MTQVGSLRALDVIYDLLQNQLGDAMIDDIQSITDSGPALDLLMGEVMGYRRVTSDAVQPVGGITIQLVDQERVFRGSPYEFPALPDDPPGQQWYGHTYTEWHPSRNDTLALEVLDVLGCSYVVGLALSETDEPIGHFCELDPHGQPIRVVGPTRANAICRAIARREAQRIVAQREAQMDERERT